MQYVPVPCTLHTSYIFMICIIIFQRWRFVLESNEIDSTFYRLIVFKREVLEELWSKIISLNYFLSNFILKVEKYQANMN